jgi:hypothetical protein
LRDLVKIRKHFTNLLLMLYIWVASSFNFYLINYITKNLPGDFFMNSLISSLTDVIVAALSGLAYAKMGLRLVFSAFFAMSAVGGLLIVVLGESLEGYVPMMLSFAKGGIKIAIDTCYLANSTLFPAIFAGTAFGFCNAGAKIATIFAPMFAEISLPLPIIVFCAISCLGSVLSWLLKENIKESEKKDED